MLVQVHLHPFQFSNEAKLKVDWGWTLRTSATLNLNLGDIFGNKIHFLPEFRNLLLLKKKSLYVLSLPPILKMGK